MEIQKTIGRNIATLRKMRGFSQEEMAYSANISVSTYSRIERGERNCSIKTLNAIAGILRVPPCQLLAADYRNCRKDPCALLQEIEEEM